MTSISTWDDEYARISRGASQLRTSSSSSSFSNSHQNSTSRQQQIQSIQTGLKRLKSSLENMHTSGMIGSSDYNRRMGLLSNLENQVDGSGNGIIQQQNRYGGDLLGGGDHFNYSRGDSGNSGVGLGLGGGGGQRMSTTTQALRHQDQMIDELASGVSRLKDQTLMINDEANTHNRMLDDMDGDIETARLGLEAETARAVKLKEDQSVWRLYMIIAALSILLFLLIMTGL